MVKTLKLLYGSSAISVLCGTALYITSILSLSASATPVSDYGTLTVSGSAIKDKSGNTVRLRGMSLYWSQGKAGRDFYNAGVVNWLAEDWHVNIIRAAMGVEGDWSTVEKGYLSDATTNKTRVTTVVDAAIAKGIYVIIDWHDHNATAHQTQAVAFFTEMAKKYKGNPNVIYEIYNEPDDETWTAIKTYVEAVIAAIRAEDPTNLIIVGTPSYSSDVVTAANSPITGYTNIAYAFHMYASEEWHHNNYMTAGSNAIAKGLPLFVTEWGLTLASGTGTINTSWVDEFVNWMETNKLSSCAWSISDLTETSSALKAGTWDANGNLVHTVSTTGNWSTSDLQTTGTYMRTKLRALNPAWSGTTAVLRDATVSSSAAIAIRNVQNGYAVSLDTKDKWVSAALYTANGQLIRSFSVSNQSTLTIPLDGQCSNTLFLQLSTGSIQKTCRLPAAKY